MCKIEGDYKTSLLNEILLLLEQDYKFTIKIILYRKVWTLKTREEDF